MGTATTNPANRLDGGRRMRVVQARLWVRTTLNGYVGECLELGIQVEEDTPEKAQRSLLEAYRAWVRTAQQAGEAGEIVVYTPVRFYAPKRIAFDTLFVLAHYIRQMHHGRPYRRDTWVRFLRGLQKDRLVLRVG